MEKKNKIKFDQKTIDDISETNNFPEKEIFKDFSLLNLKENPFKIREKRSEQMSIIDSDNKVIYSETKKSVKINSDMKNDNLIDYLNLLQFIDKEPTYQDSNPHKLHSGRYYINYDINDMTIDFLNSNKTNKELSHISNFELSNYPEYLYLYFEINQFFNKQTKFIKKNKLFNQSIGMSRIIMENYKKIISEKVDFINDIIDLQNALISEIEKEAILLTSNHIKNKEKRNKEIFDKKLNSNFAKKGINGLNSALEKNSQTEKEKVISN